MSKGITNGYLENISKKILGKNFLGVFPCDVHPKINNKPEFYIIFNLSKHNETGSHFVCLYSNKKNIFYFDSFGEKLKNEEINNFVKNQKGKIKENTVKIQCDQSDFCGFFCLGFLISKKMKLPQSKFFSKFHRTKLDQNDKKIIKFICTNM